MENLKKEDLFLTFAQRVQEKYSELKHSITKSRDAYISAATFVYNEYTFLQENYSFNLFLSRVSKKIHKLHPRTKKTNGSDPEYTDTQLLKQIQDCDLNSESYY